MSIKVKNCKTCGIVFENWYSNYCSIKCRDINTTTLKGSIKTGNDIVCTGCGELFYAAMWEQVKNRKFCSRVCADGNKTKQIYVYLKCSNAFCNQQFEKSKYEYLRAKSNNFYCCVKCLNIARSQKASENRKFTGTKPELLFAELLRENNIDYCSQYWINWKKGWKKFYDFYLPNIDTLVEIDGTYWHGKGLKDDELNNQQIKTRENDKIKNQLSKDQNYKLIRIWEDDIKTFDIKLLR